MSFIAALPPKSERGLLTERQRSVYEFVCRYIKTERGSPSIAEIAAHFGFHSVNAAQQHVEAIIKKGWLRRHRNSGQSGHIGSTARSLRIA